MIRSLPLYFEHLDTNKDSFIARIYGICTIRIDSFEPIHVMIMQNTLPAVPHSEMHYCFDIKGSSINREVLKRKSNKEIFENPTKGKVLKDLDYLRLKELKNFMVLD